MSLDWIEAHERALVVGTRVKVRLSGECRWFHDPWVHEHPGIVDHLYTGLIPNENDGHRYAVHLAGDFSGPHGLTPRLTYFAACELEILEPRPSGGEPP